MKRDPDTDSAAGRAWSALQLALEQHTPACEGDTRYTSDTLTNADKTDMATICESCPLLELCRTYKTTARPKAGHWAITSRKESHRA